MRDLIWSLYQSTVYKNRGSLWIALLPTGYASTPVIVYSRLFGHALGQAWLNLRGRKLTCALRSASSGNLFSTYCIILASKIDFSFKLGPWFIIFTSLFFIQSSSILLMAFMTFTSGDFSISPTRIGPMKDFRISEPITATRFLTRSRLRISNSDAAAVFSWVVGVKCSRDLEGNKN